MLAYSETQREANAGLLWDGIIIEAAPMVQKEIKIADAPNNDSHGNAVVTKKSFYSQVPR